MKLMQHECDREAAANDETAELLSEPERKGRIDGRERLIAEQETRTAHKRARNADALALAARELVCAHHCAVEKPDLFQGQGSALAQALRPRQQRQRMARIGEPQKHILDSRKPSDQSVILEDRRGYAARLLERRSAVEAACALNEDRAPARLDQSIQCAHQRRLANA